VALLRGGSVTAVVADMDFVSPEPVVRALRERAEHGVYGYRKSRRNCAL